MKQLNNIMRMRENNTPSLEKGDPNKVWCYETTETMAYSEFDAFVKIPKKIYAIEDS